MSKEESKPQAPSGLARCFCCLACCRLGTRVTSAGKKLHDKVAHSEKEIDHAYRPNRWPTDIWCIILFVAFWMGMGVIAVFGIERGNPRSLILPTDVDDNFCGEENSAKKLGKKNVPYRDFRNKTVLWYPFQINVLDPEKSRLKDALDMGICVYECPTDSALTFGSTLQDVDDPDDLQEAVDKAIICEYDLQHLSSYEKAMLIKNDSGGCYMNWLPTYQFNRRCFPDFSLSSNFSALEKATMTAVLKGTNAIKAGWYELQAAFLVFIFLVAIMCIVCFIFLCLVQLFLKFIVYSTLYILFLVIGTIAAYAGWIGYRKYIQGRDADDSAQKRWSYVYMSVGGAFALIEFVYLTLMIFMMNRIGIAIEIIGVAAKPIQKVFWMMLVPPFTFAGAIAISVYWVIIAAYIQSAKVPIEFTGEDYQELAEYVSVNKSVNATTIISSDKIIQGFQYYHLFGYFWTLAFIMAFGYMVVAGVVSNWYFSSHVPGKKKPGLFPVVRSFGRVLIFHMGSVLFGSLLVAIVQMLRVIVHRVEKTVKRATGENKVTKALFRILKIVLWICEKIIKFINKNAYILIMIHGQSFCCASVRAIALILTNILQIGVVNFIGDFMLFLGQIGLTVIGTLVCYFLIDIANDVPWLNWMIFLAPKENVEGQELHQIKYQIIPVFAGMIISFVVAGLFTNLYATSIDTILLCFCEDRKVNKGTEEKPYYMPPALEVKLGCNRIDMHLKSKGKK